ncbi:MAG TPA: 5'-nucleotidase, lipoprotein e(P4) family [Chitinophagaceae bacterium]|nr:5'-nucleotidase, lipoprotein e(P4) family [Chitinophagaceae bacterium]
MKKISIAVLFIITACTTSKQITKTALSSENILVTGKMFGSLYQQRAAEYKALCLQAFNIARLRVNENLQNSGKPKAIITDIDETILDNSPYEVHQTLQGKDYEAASWSQWTAMGQADTVPGAPAFLKYAASKGITIFYITNRDEKEREGTLLNLQKFNLPNADNAHLVLRQGSSSKETRRQQVAASHEIVLLLGDNLADFSSLFDKKSMDEREQNTDNLASEFGKKFIVIPNAVYGDWESTVYKYSNTLTAAQKDSVIKNLLKGY